MRSLGGNTHFQLIAPLFHPFNLDELLTQIVLSYSHDAVVGRENDGYSQVSPVMFVNSCNADDSDDELLVHQGHAQQSQRQTARTVH